MSRSTTARSKSSCSPPSGKTSRFPASALHPAPRIRVRRLLIITAALLLSAAQPAGAATIDNTVGRMIARSSFSGKHTTLMVWDRSSGRLLAVHKRDLELRPASNMKLLTSSAVLEREGTSARLRTRVYATGSLSGGTLRGCLWLVGGGDPSLSTNVFAVKA